MTPSVDIKLEHTIREIVTTYPETRDVFTGNGFPQFRDDAVLNGLGRFLKLGSALDQRKMDRDTFLALLKQRVLDTRHTVDVTLKVQQESRGDVTVAGLLPCPVRVPLLEIVDREVNRLASETGIGVTTRLEAASGGMAPFEDMLQGDEAGSSVPDIFLSAGFETFFGEKDLGRFRRKGFFKDPMPTGMNRAFDGLNLADPTGSYGVIGVVPAVFLVNLDVLGDRPVPRSWEALLTAEFEQQVSLPVGDFDLFNAMLLTLHARYGDDGIRALGRSMLQARHPSQMIKEGAVTAPAAKPTVTIMPYFFTKMAGRVSTMEIVWPEDGAILSPIFMAVRADRADRVAPLVAVFKSREVGELLAHRGLFPATHPEVENPLPEQAPFMWIGWDRIDGGRLDSEMAHTMRLFEETAKEVRA